LQLFVRDQTSGETRLLTRTPSEVPSQSSTDFPAVSFSVDGLRIAFQSSAPDLVAGDENGGNDVFLYDWATDQLQLVSRRADSLPSRTTPAFLLAGTNCLSGDGRYLVFVSTGHGLTDIDPKGIANVYVRDLVTGSNRLVSASLDNTGGANMACLQSTISADGRWIAFTSLATNLVANDTNRVEDVFLRDQQTSRTLLVSHNLSGQSGNAESSMPPGNR
jgi:Tol biopolymer transport system component